MVGICSASLCNSFDVCLYGMVEGFEHCILANALTEMTLKNGNNVKRWPEKAVRLRHNQKDKTIVSVGLSCQII